MGDRVGAPALLLALLLGGCATAAIPPPTGSMWAFFTDIEPTLGPRAMIYTISQVACERERQQRLASPTPCVPVVIGPGTGYYAIALPNHFDATLPGGGIGTLDRDRCERLRTDLFRSFSAMGDCQPVAVRRGP
jgi:hypothetical protein